MTKCVELGRKPLLRWMGLAVWGVVFGVGGCGHVFPDPSPIHEGGLGSGGDRGGGLPELNGGADSGSNSGGESGAEAPIAGTSGNGGAGGVATECNAGAQRCGSDGVVVLTCDEGGVWDAHACLDQACPVGGQACAGECRPGTTRCRGNGVETCDALGSWSETVDCDPTMPSCSECGLPPSCNGLAANCGSTGDAGCCESPVVEGGSYNRSQNANYPATVSSFRLDRFEVTVGRFQKFVADYAQDMIPVGAGKNLNDPEDPGWIAAYAAELPTDATALIEAVKCDAAYQTFDSDNPLRPMNCLSWYVANAFCTWDGGRLPTEAEWNYAAAGGNEQRPYAWGSTVPAADTALAVYGCYYNRSGDGCTGVSNIAPVGSISAGMGRWRQADLAGGVWEWTQDFGSASYTSVSCINCANHITDERRIDRGGSFFDPAKSQLTAIRARDYPGDRLAVLGVRCARAM